MGRFHAVRPGQHVGSRPRPEWRGPGRVHLPEPGSRTTQFSFLFGLGGAFAGSGLRSDAGATRVRCAPGCGLASQAPLSPPARETRQEVAHGPQSLASTGGQRRLRLGF